MKTAPMHLEIKEDAPEEGRTAASPGKPNAKVAVDADAQAVRALFLESLANQKINHAVTPKPPGFFASSASAAPPRW